MITQCLTLLPRGVPLLAETLGLCGEIAFKETLASKLAARRKARVRTGVAGGAEDILRTEGSSPASRWSFVCAERVVCCDLTVSYC